MITISYSLLKMINLMLFGSLILTVSSGSFLLNGLEMKRASMQDQVSKKNIVSLIEYLAEINSIKNVKSSSERFNDDVSKLRSIIGVLRQRIWTQQEKDIKIWKDPTKSEYYEEFIFSLNSLKVNLNQRIECLKTLLNEEIQGNVTEFECGSTSGLSGVGITSKLISSEIDTLKNELENINDGARSLRH